jgi:hypothetical protein
MPSQPGNANDRNNIQELRDQNASNTSKGPQPSSNKYKQRESAQRPSDPRHETNEDEDQNVEGLDRHEAQQEQDNANYLAPLQLASENQHLR